MLPELPYGYTVEYVHERFAEPLLIKGRTLNSEVQAQTLAVLIDPDGEAVCQGVAYCGINDQFNRRLGRTIALGRAIKKLKEAEHA